MNANPLSPIPATDTLRTASPHTPDSPNRFTTVDPLRVLREHLWLLVATAVLSVGLGVGVYFGWAWLAPRYTSETRLTVSGGISDPYQLRQQAEGWGHMAMELIDAIITNQIQRLMADDVLDGALKRDDVRATDWFKKYGDSQSGGSATEAREELRDSLYAGRIRNSTLILVKFTADNPNDPPVILDAVVSIYLNKVLTGSEGEQEKIRQAFLRDRNRAEEDQNQIEEQLRQFTIQNDLPALESRNHEATIAYKLLSEERAKYEVALQSARDAYSALLASVNAGSEGYSPQQLAEAEADPSVVFRKQRLSSLREERDVLLERFGPNHRSVRQADLQITMAERERDRQIQELLRKRQTIALEEAKSAIDSLESQLASLLPKIEENRNQLRDLGLRFQEYKRIEERAKIASDRRALVEERLNAMRTQSDRPDVVQVRQDFGGATEAEMSMPPDPPFTVAGTVFLMVGLVLGVVFVKESLDQRIKSPADVAQLPNCPLLGVIPDVTEDPSNPDRIEGVVSVNPTGLIAEAFRQVRTALMTPMERGGHRTLLVVGAQAHSGTSAVVNNLAIGMAVHGKKVLVLDANYRRPAQHQLFGATPEPGLIEVLSESATFDEAVAQVESPPLDLLPVGHAPNAIPEIFESTKFKQLLDQLKGRYDVILIDAPPALLTSDSTLMIKHVDAVAVVVRAMEDMKGMITRMVRQLDSQHTGDLLGVILNGVRSSAGGYYRKNYKAFYHYRQGGAFLASGPKADPELVDAMMDQE